MLPIWIDEDVDSSNTVSKVVRDKLFAILSDEHIEVDFCDALLRHQRLLVIIDRLSERSAETLEYIRNIYRATRLGALIITSRSKLPVDGISPILLFPQPLSSASLLFFMTGLLSILAVKGTETNLELSPLQTISEQLDLGQRLSGVIQVRTRDGNQEIPILPLPVRLFIEQAFELLSNGSSLDDLPSSLPEVYVQYLHRINPKTAGANLLSDEDMLKAAIALGKIALRPNFIPKEFAPEAAREAVKKIGWGRFDGVDPIERLKANGVIVQKQIGAYSRLRFVLDPIAEFLGAFAYAEECGAKKESWKQILDETSVAAPGFHIALKLIRQAYGSRLGWAGDETLERF